MADKVLFRGDKIHSVKGLLVLRASANSLGNSKEDRVDLVTFLKNLRRCLEETANSEDNKSKLRDKTSF